jgi:hypothetical protein
MTTAGSTVLDCLCMPTPPNWSFSSTNKGSSQWEAPWWVPLPYKTNAFRILCTATSDNPQHSIVRFAVSWNSQGPQQQLGILRLTDHYDRYVGTYIKRQRWKYSHQRTRIRRQSPKRYKQADEPHKTNKLGE